MRKLRFSPLQTQAKPSIDQVSDGPSEEHTKTPEETAPFRKCEGNSSSDLKVGIEEEKEDKYKGPLSSSSSCAAIELRDLIFAYVRSIGVVGGTGYVERSYWTGDRWTHDERPIEFAKVATAVTDSRTRVAVTGLETCACLVIDVDAHGIDPDDETGMSFDVAIDRGAKRKAYRQRVIDACRPVVEELERRHPWGWLIESSQRGMHCVLKISERVPVAVLEDVGQAIALELERVAGEGVGVEAFPQGDRMCALPLTGSARLLGSGLDKPIAFRRVDAIRLFVTAPAMPVDAFAFAAAHLAGVDGIDSSIPVARRSTEDRSSVAPVEGGQLRGYRFAVCVDRMLTEGIDDDRSWETARRLAAACVYLGIEPELARRFFERWLERGDHRATHCQTRAGRTALVRTFEACLQRQLRGVARGEVRVGEMQSSSIRSRILFLAGAGADRQRIQAKTPFTKTPFVRAFEKREAAISKMRSDAMRARWERVRKASAS